MKYSKAVALGMPLFGLMTHRYFKADSPSTQPKWSAHDLQPFKKRSDHLK